MTPVPDRGATVDLSPTQELTSLAEEYRAAWQAALVGGRPPIQDVYLANVPEPGRSTLQQQLTELDDRYGSYLSQHRQQAASTVDFSGRARPDGPGGGDTTLQSHFEADARSDATVDFNAAAAKATDDGFTTCEPSPVPGYEFLGELGRGGMGVVYKARQKALNRLVALKMLLAGTHASSEHLARFHTEAEAVAHLQHPNIVQIYEVAQHEGLAYFSLEFVDGASLAHQLGGNPQPPRHAAQLIMVLARAMHHAHESGIVHRDLKPANVLMTSSGVPKITDFGLAKRLEGDSSQTKSGTLMGTPSYMAPEQARGDAKNVGPPADIHALGAILYEMLTGRPPFVSANMMDTILQVLKQDPIPPSQLQPKLSADLETICLKCLQKEPHQRYLSAGALADDLDCYLAGEPIHARPVGGVERLWRWCKRNPRVAALAATVLALLVAGIIGSTAAAVVISQEKNQKEREREAADAARLLAEERKLEADKAKEQAQKNAQEAIEQSWLALESLRTLVLEAQKEISKYPNLKPLQLKLAEIALERIEKVVKNDKNSRLMGQVTAGAYEQLGGLYRQLGKSEEAFALYVKCHEVLQGMADREPEGDVAQSNLAKSFRNLGQMSLELRRDVQAALDYYQKGLAIFQKLSTRKLSDKLSPADVKESFAESYIRVGVIYLQLGEPQKAQEHFQEALKLRQELAAGAPKDAAVQLNFARSSNAVGEAEFRTRDWPSARDHFEKSVSVSEQVHHDQPKNPGIQLEFANRLGNFGVFEMRTGNGAAARPLFTRALELLQELVEVDRQTADYQRYLGLGHYRMATLARRLNDTASMERSNQACLEIREKLAAANPMNERRQMELVLALPRCAQQTRAAEMAAKIEAGEQVDREVLIEIAQCYAQCAAAETANSALRQQYVDRALAAVQRALGKGFKDVVMLETEPDLDALRDQPGFQSLLAQLKKP